MSQARPGYLATTRMHSTRTVGMEWIGEEGKRSFYLPYGANLLYRSGDEYKNIFPVWDWARVPGVTAEHLSAFPDYDRQNGLADFVGGVSDGQVGAAALDLQMRGGPASAPAVTLTGRKAWFYFDEAYVCLGAGISGNRPNPVYTSLNQCLRNGAVTAKLGSAAPAVVAPTTNANGTALAAPRWVHHDGAGYVFPGASPANLVLKNQSQAGSWSLSGGGSTTVVSADVFSLWLNHGLNPSGAAYQYVVVPDVTPAQLDAYTTSYAGGLPVRALANTPGVQAVRHDGAGITQAAFYQAGAVLLQPGRTLAVDQPCLAMLRETAASATLAVSNPLNAALNVTVTLPGLWQGAGATRNAATNTTQVVFALPGGEYAGQSVVRPLARVAPLAAATPAGAAPTTVYPNPVADQLTVAGGAAGTPAQVRDLLGRTVLTAKLGAGGTLDVRALAPGTYLLVWGAGPRHHVARIIKSSR